MEKYYKYVYEAEQLLVLSRFDSACIKYQVAFKYSVPLYSDLKNAFKCALLGNNKKMIHFFWKKMTFFPELVSNIKETPDVLNHKNNIVRPQIIKYSKAIEKTRVDTLLDSIKKADQLSRNECGDNNSKMCIDKFRRIDSTNIKKIYEILSSNSNNKTVYGQNVLHAIFLIAWHARRWGYTDLDSTIASFISKGFMKPFFLAKLISYRSDFDAVNSEYLDKQMNIGFGTLYWAINDTVLLFRPFEKNTLDEINSNRTKLYMDDALSEVIKIKFIKQNELFRFSGEDLGVDAMTTIMTKEDLNEIVADLKAKGVLIE